jgi:hypothetical protein
MAFAKACGGEVAVVFRIGESPTPLSDSKRHRQLTFFSFLLQRWIRGAADLTSSARETAVPFTLSVPCRPTCIWSFSTLLLSTRQSSHQLYFIFSSLSALLSTLSVPSAQQNEALSRSLFIFLLAAVILYVSDLRVKPSREFSKKKTENTLNVALLLHFS